MKTNIIYNKDCMEIFKELPNESIDLIVTDPPYPVTLRGNSGNAGGMFLKDINKKGLVFEHNNIHCSQYAPAFFRVLKNGSHLYVMTNHINLIEMLNEFTKVGFHFIKSLIWDKQNKIMGRFYMSQFEYILFFRKRQGIPINNCGTSDIIPIPNKKLKKDNEENYHDTEKPVELMSILINNSSKENDVVFDPFMGIGSTCIAAKNNNRQYIGCEIDENYFTIAQKRINALTTKSLF